MAISRRGNGPLGARNLRLKHVREDAGVSPEEMALRCGKSVASIRAYERGATKPGYSVLREYAEISGESIDWLVGDEQEPNDRVRGDNDVSAYDGTSHPGIRSLAQADLVRREEKISDQEIQDLHKLRGQWGDGTPIIMWTLYDALNLLYVHRRAKRGGVEKP